MSRRWRWGFNTTFSIPCEDGDLYLFRRRLLQTPWFGIYIHDIYEPDGDRDPHNHPWSFISIVLRGWYIERLYLDPIGDPDTYETWTYRRFSAHRMGRMTAHRIVEAAPGLKTLVLTGPRSKEDWGFFQRVTIDDDSRGEFDIPDRVIGRFVPWQKYRDDNRSQ